MHDTTKIRKHLGFEGKMLGSSKSGYRERHPAHAVIFNANVFTRTGKDTYKKIWYGDFCLTNDEDSLIKLSIDLDTDIFLLREMDGRFENENTPLIGRAVYVVSQRGLKFHISPDFIRNIDGQIVLKQI